VGRRRYEDKSPQPSDCWFWKGFCPQPCVSFFAKIRAEMGDRTKEDKIVAEHNGQVFRFNEVVHVFEGTAAGLPGKKTEFIKAWFKGVDKTKEEERFICRPVVGHSGGPFPRFSKGSVYKVKVLTLNLASPLSQTLTPIVSLTQLECLGVRNGGVGGTWKEKSLGTFETMQPREVRDCSLSFPFVFLTGV
jgi:hypothetical protein